MGRLNISAIRIAAAVADCSPRFDPFARCLEITRDSVMGSPLDEIVRNTAKTVSAT